MYAIVKTGGKQYRVEEGDSLLVDRLHAKEGAELILEPLLLGGDDGAKAVIGGSELEKVKVEATVAGHARGEKLHVLKFKPKIGDKRRTGHRSELTRLEIKEIKLLSRKPATKGEAGAGTEKAAARPKSTAGTARGAARGKAGGRSRSGSGATTRAAKGTGSGTRAGGKAGGSTKGGTAAGGGKARSTGRKSGGSRKQEN